MLCPRGIGFFGVTDADKNSEFPVGRSQPRLTSIALVRSATGDPGLCTPEVDGGRVWMNSTSWFVEELS